MYFNGMGFRAIAIVTEIDHTNIINWLAEAGESLSIRWGHMRSYKGLTCI
ncbi:MAG: hypothetical protein AAF298_19950 [Cyanobacteria bacterium P01_A01_bin.40]